MINKIIFFNIMNNSLVLGICLPNLMGGPTNPTYEDCQLAVWFNTSYLDPRRIVLAQACFLFEIRKQGPGSAMLILNVSIP
jgi:hypothetical protein